MTTQNQEVDHDSTAEPGSVALAALGIPISAILPLL